MLIMVCYFKRIWGINQAEDRVTWPDLLHRHTIALASFREWSVVSAWLRIRAQPWNPCQPRNSALAWTCLINFPENRYSMESNNKYQIKREIPRPISSTVEEFVIEIIWEFFLLWSSCGMPNIETWLFYYFSGKSNIFLIKFALSSWTVCEMVPWNKCDIYPRQIVMTAVTAVCNIVSFVFMQITYMRYVTCLIPIALYRYWHLHIAQGWLMISAVQSVKYTYNSSCYPRPVLAFGYCHRLRLCVCPCVCVSITCLSAR